MQTLVLGIGNILLQDEGIGVRVVEELQRRYHIPPEVTVMDGGTAGMALLEDLLDKENVILVDAVKASQPAATVIRLWGDEVPAFFQTAISPHQLGISELLATLRLAGKVPQNIVLIGIVPKSTELSLELSDEISQKMDTLVEGVVQELSRLGFELTLKEQVINA